MIRHDTRRYDTMLGTTCSKTAFCKEPCVTEDQCDETGDPALKKDRELARVDIDKLRTELKIQGFYLQLPSATENLLKTHLQQQNTD